MPPLQFRFSSGYRPKIILKKGEPCLNTVRELGRSCMTFWDSRSNNKIILGSTKKKFKGAGEILGIIRRKQEIINPAPLLPSHLSVPPFGGYHQFFKEGYAWYICPRNSSCTLTANHEDLKLLLLLFWPLYLRFILVDLALIGYLRWKSIHIEI